MKKLKELLERRGITQRALSEHMGCSPAAIAQWMNHGRSPKSWKRGNAISMVRDFLADRGVPPREIEAAMAAPNTPKKDRQMILRKQYIEPNARRHFNIFDKFRDPLGSRPRKSEDIFLNDRMRMIREQMFLTAMDGGFDAVIGESGAGKSTLRRDLVQRLMNEKARVIEPYVVGMEETERKGKLLRADHIAEAILRELAPKIPARRSTEAQFANAHRELKNSSIAGYANALIIEEAHAIPIPTLKHLKRYLDLDNGHRDLISIILIGQQELLLKLSHVEPAVREVVGRCRVLKIEPLGSDLHAYIDFKCRLMGKRAGDILDDGAISFIRERMTFPEEGRYFMPSLLYPLAIDNLIAKTMNIAAALKVKPATADQVREAIANEDGFA
uniref:Type II secretory pathway, component ExeA (Predicted ATPase) n=1 Tax=Candidatus Kentrum sp. TC TaxID=2126339 RepID=A0A450YYM2_9GAMM|nr:MAG: Type II secretory pathway, component ExeA (predicted ATPase) [Candidatus Kentron sp. TC]